MTIEHHAKAPFKQILMGYAPGGGYPDTEKMAAATWLSRKQPNHYQISRQKTELPKHI